MASRSTAVVASLIAVICLLTAGLLLFGLLSEPTLGLGLIPFSRTSSPTR